MTRKIDEMAKNVTDIKNRATALGKEAVKQASQVKGRIQTGVETSKDALRKAGEMVDKDKLHAGLEATSKGVDLVAKAAKVASRGVDGLASTLEKASAGLKDLGKKLKKHS